MHADQLLGCAASVCGLRGLCREEQYLLWDVGKGLRGLIKPEMATAPAYSGWARGGCNNETAKYGGRLRVPWWMRMVRGCRGL